MPEPKKVDYHKAQALMREGLLKVAIECDLRHDAEAFLTVMLVATSALVAEIVSDERMLEPDGPQRMIDFSVRTLSTLLREDMAGRLAHIAKKARH